jgi:hypothetical protein
MENGNTATAAADWDDPDLRAALAGLVAALTGPDPDTRRGVAVRVANDLFPETRARVVGLLADRLGSRSPYWAWRWTTPASPYSATGPRTCGLGSGSRSPSAGTTNSCDVGVSGVPKTPSEPLSWATTDARRKP